MTEADVSGFVMDVPSPRTGRYPLERDVPVIRLKNDAELREIYEFGKKLGQGSFGVVYETTHIETQTNWAIKKACRPAAGSSKVKMLEQEINILKQVTHAHIVHLKEVYATPRMMYLVTELCTGGDLKQLLRRKKFLTEDETRHIIRALADAIVYLHKRDIVHRDLKLENILVKNPPDEGDNDRINIKVADFGLSVQTGGVGIENIMTEACGTLIYMAPEMMSDRGYTQWCDAWSIGVIMYMLLCGEPPFVSQTKSLLLEEITNREVTFPQSTWATVSDAAKNLLTCLLKVDPAYRMSPNQLLENPWITGDATVPAVPSNVLIMMRNYREEEERTQILENLSLTSSEDTVDLKPLCRAAPAEADCRSPAKLRPERDSSFYPRTTSTEQTKCSEPWRPRQPTATQVCSPLTFEQPGATVKHSARPGAKQPCRPRHNKDPSPGLKNQKAASYSQRPSTSSKTKVSHRLVPLHVKAEDWDRGQPRV
ncbi:serine/threonine-protein kinase 33 isoform X3 [Solea solea]|nr:serine/threonine-protein kinase 33 isoform X3 [Solea solea]XP_058484623.1 serine/threonine-protein kinase 33 isoform X3 [Solea solea]